MSMDADVGLSWVQIPMYLLALWSWEVTWSPVTLVIASKMRLHNNATSGCYFSTHRTNTCQVFRTWHVLSVGCGHYKEVVLVMQQPASYSLRVMVLVPGRESWAEDTGHSVSSSKKMRQIPISLMALLWRLNKMTAVQHRVQHWMNDHSRLSW